MWYLPDILGTTTPRMPVLLGAVVQPVQEGTMLAVPRED